MTRTTVLACLFFSTASAVLSGCSEKEAVQPSSAESRAAANESTAVAKQVKSAPTAAKASTADLAGLVPAGTAIYIQAPSVDHLASAIRELSAAFDPSAPAMDIDEVLAGLNLPGATKEIDRSKPLGVCMVLPEQAGGEPMPTVLVPVLSPENFVRSFSESGMPATTAIHGNYVAVSMGPAASPAPTPAAIALELPAGDIVARLDVQRLVAHFRPMIDAGLAQMTTAMDSMPPEATAGMDVAPFMKLYVDGVRSVLDAGQTFDLALRLDGSVVELASKLTAREGSVLDGFSSEQKTSAKALARFLDPEAPMSAILGMDQAMMLQRMKPLIDAAFTMYPEPMRSSFQKMMGSADELAAQFGSAMCINAAFGTDGLRYAGYFQPKDPAKFLEIYRTMMSSVTGITFDEMKEGEVSGVKVMRSRMRLDVETMVGGQLDAVGKEGKDEMMAMFDRMYGEDGLAFTIGTQDGVTAVVLGGDDAYLESSLKRLSKSSTLPRGMARGLEQVGDLNPCFVMQYNLGAMMQGMQGLMGGMAGGMPLSFPNLSASFTVFGGVDGGAWHGAMSTDVKELGAAFREMMSHARAPGDVTAQPTAVEMDLQSISMALEMYAGLNGGKYPDSLDILTVPDTNGNSYLADIDDPWGGQYLYEPPSTARATPRVYTLGRDRKPGGEGEDKDWDFDDLSREDR
ncbi:MAG: type II secretion system protein GspG [Planctomycetota bacterium]